MLDSLDRKLLKCVQADSRQSIDTLAQQIGLSPAATQKRLKKLRNKRVIVREAAIVDASLVGRPMTFVISVELERERSAGIAAFRKKLADESLIQQSYYVTGHADFIVIARTADMTEFEEMAQRMFYNDTNVRKFTTSVALSACPIETQVSVEP